MKKDRIIFSTLVIFSSVLSGGTADAQTSPSTTVDTEPFYRMPVASVDLRTMLRLCVIDTGAADLAAGNARRDQAILDHQIPSYSQSIRDWVSATLGSLPFGSRGGPLHARVVSKSTRKGYRIENVIFESWPGWEVNATVYLPLAENFRPPWTPVVMPVGHCNKADESVQIPAQVFARCGYIVVTFDPPGFGEKSVGNDHFNDGVRCYLTGTTSQRFFLLDALRAIDYLATRPDVDMSHGVGMTGVSGGGVTTTYCTLLDPRIKAAAPSCFYSPEVDNPLRNSYAICPETHPIGRYQHGIETADLLVAVYPTPLLLMAGKRDTLYRADWSQKVAGEVARAYDSGGLRDHCDFFLDDSPHDYTIAQALRAIAWMDRWVRKVSARQLPTIGVQDIEMAPEVVLQCHPRTDVNMYSINRQEAEQLAVARRGTPVRVSALMLAGLDEKALRRLAPAKVNSAPPFAGLGDNSVQEMILTSDRGVELPATLLYQPHPQTKTAAILYFDDRGRWTDLSSGGPLVNISHLTTPDAKKVAIFSVDLRGWGDTSPSFGPYEMYAWGAPQRWIEYVSAALDDSIMSMRIRDGLTALAYLRARPEIDPQQIVVGGHGMGGLVALHVAEIDGHVRGVFCNEFLSSFQSLVDSPSYAWGHDAFYPNVLKYYDVPDVAADLRIAILLVDPLDPMKFPLGTEAAKQLYSQALAEGNLQLQTGFAEPQVHSAEIEWTNRVWSNSAADVRR